MPLPDYRRRYSPARSRANVQLRGDEVAFDMLPIRNRHRRIEFDQSLTRLNALAIANINGAYNASLEGLYQFDATARNDLPDADATISTCPKLAQISATEQSRTIVTPIARPIGDGGVSTISSAAGRKSTLVLFAKYPSRRERNDILRGRDRGFSGFHGCHSADGRASRSARPCEPAPREYRPRRADTLLECQDAVGKAHRR